MIMTITVEDRPLPDDGLGVGDDGDASDDPDDPGDFDDDDDPDGEFSMSVTTQTLSSELMATRVSSVPQSRSPAKSDCESVSWFSF